MVVALCQYITMLTHGFALVAGVLLDLSGHYLRDWSEYVNVIGVISEPFAHEFG